jgi:hypothetical protein
MLCYNYIPVWLLHLLRAVTAVFERVTAGAVEPNPTTPPFARAMFLRLIALHKARLVLTAAATSSLLCRTATDFSLSSGRSPEGA